MRALTLLAAITMMHTIHALPRPDLAVRQGETDLNNDRHVFQHLDRNQRTANRDRERVNKDNVGTYVVKGVSNGREREVDRRFMQGPDYSQDGSDSVKSTSNTTTTTQPAERPGETAGNFGYDDTT